MQDCNDLDWVFVPIVTDLIRIAFTIRSRRLSRSPQKSTSLGLSPRRPINSRTSVIKGWRKPSNRLESRCWCKVSSSFCIGHKIVILLCHFQCRLRQFNNRSTSAKAIFRWTAERKIYTKCRCRTELRSCMRALNSPKRLTVQFRHDASC